MRRERKARDEEDRTGRATRLLRSCAGVGAARLCQRIPSVVEASDSIWRSAKFQQNPAKIRKNPANFTKFPHMSAKSEKNP